MSLIPIDAELLISLLCHALREDSETRLSNQVQFLQKSLQQDGDLRTLTGASEGMRQVRASIQQVARTDSTVLVTGETGTGKELVARGIHQLSSRRERLLVSINCAAIPAALLSSELFGHEAGAFTGATKRRIGRFELAHCGTLFLDEIGELSGETQVMLLRVLQERKIERLGSNEPIDVDVRIVAATHKNLLELVSANAFRSDLYYRLNVFPIQTPPLRERPEDVPDLVRHFLHLFNRRMKKEVARVEPAVLAGLARYDWPGNVRELENLVERAMILSSGDVLELDPRWLGPARTPSATGSTLRDAERQMIEQALERSGGRIYGPNGAAALLGLKPTTLYGKMTKLGIERKKSHDDK